MSKRKPIIVTVYNDGSSMRSKLDALGVKYTTTSALNVFWGVQFTIDRPSGKGSTAKLNQLYKLIS